MSMTKIVPKISSKTIEVATNPTIATLLHLPVGGGGVDGGLELVVVGGGVNEELLQLSLPLPPRRSFGLAAAALLGDVALGPDPRPRWTPRRRGVSISIVARETREEDAPGADEELDTPAS
jgi:hypothetical protein